ncbi:unnamed protein product [Cylicocyclus nassatus]|uniref:Phlebovirus glycoprotein G2 fusion domain-containing protein n=1 Tax=Cylicocyclus nassatus TaxID=53992 RepID=A0AA36M0R1_CYLNA|nr:unnamed protein product [Cylicocyclus nassatus]
MAMRLGTSKRLLTRYTKKLEAVITHLKNERLETRTATSQEGEVLRDSLRQLNEGIGAITAFTEKIEKLLMDYATDVSSLQDLDEQEVTSFEEYSAKAEETLASAFDYLVLLQSRRQAYTVYTSRAGEASNTTLEAAEGTTPVQPRPVNLLVPLELEEYQSENTKEADAGGSEITPTASSFISNGNNTALWDNQLKPALRCPTSKAARTLRCEIFEQCTCNPAETKANCNCLNVPILKQFEDLQRRMPVILPSITFEESIHGVKATVQNMLSTEIIVTLQEDLRTNLVVDNDICTVENTQLIGCYNCEKGAHAKIKCFSSRSSKAEIICERTSFTAPCGKQGIESIMRISPTQAMVRMKCSVSCGQVVTAFEVGGILKYTATFEAMFYKWLTSNRESASAEIKWPDFYHLFDVFSQWYKTVLIAGITLIAMLGITYVLISTCGLRCVIILAKLSAAELDGETTFLKTILRIASPQAEFLEPQLQAILKSLHNQKKVATTQRTQWTSLMGEANFLQSSTNEQLMVTNRCLRSATQTKEKILRLGTWYILTDRIYDRQVQANLIPRGRRFQWLEKGKKQEYDVNAESVLKMVQSLMSFTKTSISMMEDHLNKVERQVNESEEAKLAVQCKQLKERIQEIELDWADQVERLERENRALKEKIQEQYEDRQMDWSAEVEETTDGSRAENKEQEKEKGPEQNDDAMDWTAPTEEIAIIDQADDDKTKDDDYEDDKSEENMMETTFSTIEKLMDQEDSSERQRDYHIVDDQITKSTRSGFNP